MPRRHDRVEPKTVARPRKRVWLEIYDEQDREVLVDGPFRTESHARRQMSKWVELEGGRLPKGWFAEVVS